MTATTPTRSPWGNPAQSTFERRFVRLVAVDEWRVKVHIVLQPIVERVLRDLAQADFVVDELHGWPEHPDATTLQLRVGGLSAAEVALTMAEYGFDSDEEHVYRWAGTYEEAVERGAQADAELDAALAGQQPNAAPNDAPPAAAPVEQVERLTSAPEVATSADAEWNDELVGSRELHGGERGRDVLFWQAYLDVERTGIYDEATQEAVRAFKRKRLRPDTPTIDREVYQQLQQRLRKRLTRGDAGRHVRMVSALLIGASWADRSSPVHSAFARDLDQLVRGWQTLHGHPRNGIVSPSTWDTLMRHPWA